MRVKSQVGEQKNTIVINGKLYNARTGKEVHGDSRLKQMSSASAFGQTMDGFFRSAPPQTGQKTSASATPKREARPAHKKAHSARHVHKRSEHASTLMRSSVKRPKNTKPVAVSGHLEPEEAKFFSDGKESTTTHHERAKRANTIHKSHLVKRFNREVPEPVVEKSTAPIKVKPHPKETISQHYVPAIQQSIEAQPAETSESIFATALSHANSHEQKPLKAPKARHKAAKKMRMSNKTLNVSASVILVLVLAGFVAYQNMANLSMRAAAAKAGINASLPAYRPAGFALARGVQSGPGQVVINFNSNSDDRNFSISQTSSNWNSQSLLDNFVALNDQPYQQLNQDNGKTVFVYGDDATWVEGGVWYKIEGQSSLSTEQLLKIANSF